MRPLLLALALVPGCATCAPVRPSPTPTVIVDAGPVPAWDLLDPCGSAWAKLESLGCVPSSAGNWVAACVNARANGLTFSVECIRSARVRGDLSECHVTCSP